METPSSQCGHPRGERSDSIAAYKSKRKNGAQKKGVISATPLPFFACNYTAGGMICQMFSCIYFRTIHKDVPSKVDMEKEIRYIFYCNDIVCR